MSIHIEHAEFSIIVNNAHEKMTKFTLNFYSDEQSNKKYNTIIIAGENGTYKTSILKSIYQGIDNNFNNKEKNLIRNKLDFFEQINVRQINPIYIKGLKIQEKYRSRNDMDKETRAILHNIYNSKQTYNGNLIDKFKEAFDKFFSEKDLSFDNTHIDISSDSISPDNFKIKSEYKNSEYINLTKIDMPVIECTEKGFMLKFAFNAEIHRSDKNLLPVTYIKQSLDMYVNVITGQYNYTQNKIDVMFKKHDELFEMKDLSDGEMNIVYLGANLINYERYMKEVNSHQYYVYKDGIVLIDEPELSMHPKWQKRILEYYQDLLSEIKLDKNGKPEKDNDGNYEKEQTAQLIVATHSPYIIESAMTGKPKDDTLIIILKEEKEGKITPTRIYYNGDKWIEDIEDKHKTEQNNNDKIKKTFLLPSITSAEINRRVFDIFSKNYLFQLYSLLSAQIAETNKYTGDPCNKLLQAYIKKDGFDHKNEFDQNYYIRGDEALPTFLRNAYAHVEFLGDKKEREVKEFIKGGKPVSVDEQLEDACKLLEEILGDDNTIKEMQKKYKDYKKKQHQKK